MTATGPSGSCPPTRPRSPRRSDRVHDATHRHQPASRPDGGGDARSVAPVAGADDESRGATDAGTDTGTDAGTAVAGAAGAPYGREQVMEAVLEAATVLFAERGFAGTSVRDVAVRAGVAHSLVHRHFGTKRALVRAVLERTASLLAEQQGGIADTRRDAGRTVRFQRSATVQTRLLAWAMLERIPMSEVQTRFLTAHRYVELLAVERAQRDPAGGGGARWGRHTDDRLGGVLADSRVAVAAAAALLFGWDLFAPYLHAAFDLDEALAPVGGDRGDDAVLTALLQVLLDVAR